MIKTSSLLCCLLGAALAAPSTTPIQNVIKDKWFFTTENALDKKGKNAVAQELTVPADYKPTYGRPADPPKLTLVCSTLTRSRIRFVLSEAGIFNTYFQSNGRETSQVDLRWETKTGATSFIETVWTKAPALDMLNYDPSDNEIRTMLISETLLLEPSVKVGGGGIARFDIRGLRDHLPQLTECAKQIAKVLPQR